MSRAEQTSDNDRYLTAAFTAAKRGGQLVATRMRGEDFKWVPESSRMRPPSADFGNDAAFAGKRKTVRPDLHVRECSRLNVFFR